MTQSYGPSRSAARIFLLAAAVALSVVAGGAPARGQGSKATGVIEGVVSDEVGAVVPNAGATVTWTETGVSFTTASDAEGRYRFAFLPPGTYMLRVTAPGFAEGVYDKIELSVGQSINLPVILVIAGIGMVVVVDTPPIDTTSTSVATTVNERSVENLPILGRKFEDLLTLTPGISFPTQNGAGVSVHGSRDRAFNFTLDGIDVSSESFDGGRGSSASRQSFSVESVREFNVITNGAPAEFGRSSGGFINVITKSGTSEFRGSAYLYVRDKALASDNPGEVRAVIPEKDFRWLQPGVTFGGPIKPKRAFFFTSYDRRDGESSRPNRIDPRLVRILAQRFGSPAEEGLIERADKSDSAFGKVDVNSDKLNLAARYGYSRYTLKNRAFDVPSWGRSANSREESHTNVINGNLHYTLRATLVNEFRSQYSRASNSGVYEGPDLPDMSIGGTDPLTGELTSYRFGRAFFLPNSSSTARLQFTYNFSALLGPHSFKAGFEFSRDRVGQVYPAFARGRYIFASVEAFERYLEDPRDFGGLLYYSQFASAAGRSVNQAGTQEFSQIEPSFFVQDTWRVRSDLTAAYGLRYMAQLQDQPITPLRERRYAQFIGQPGFPSDGSIPSEKGGWQPRLGIAWDPTGDGKTVIRANMDIYYATVPGFLVAGARNTDGVVAYTISTCCGLDFLPTPPPELGVFTDSTRPAPFNPGVRVFASDFENPRTLQWGANIQREITNDLVANFSFIYTNSVNLTRFVNRNGPAFTGNFDPDGRRLFDGPRPFARPDGSGIGELVTAESSARSLYRAFIFEAVKRYSRKYQFTANYVLSWSYSDDDKGNPFSLPYADVLDLRPEYSYSDSDHRHSFNASGLVELPYGFQLSGIFQARSAQPDSLFLLSDANGDGNAFDRPFRARRDIGRNTVRKRNRRSSVSIRIKRTTKFGEKRRLELFSEIFNMFNSTNPIPLTNPLLFNFDTVVRTGFDNPRQAQLGVKLIF